MIMVRSANWIVRLLLEPLCVRIVKLGASVSRNSYPSSVHLSLLVDLFSIAVVVDSVITRCTSSPVITRRFRHHPGARHHPSSPVDSVITQVHVELSEAQRIGTIRGMLVPPKATDRAAKGVSTLTASVLQTVRILS